MDEDTISDLKQFIATTTKQETSGIRHELKKLYLGQIRLERKIDDGFASVAEALDTMNDEYGYQIQTHEKRITKLEQKAA